MSNANDGWSIDVPDPDVLNFIKKLDPTIKDEIYQKLKSDCAIFDKFGSGPRRCSSGLYKIDNHSVEGEEFYMKAHFANAEKQIRIIGFEVFKT